ncbi:MAG TPA: PEP-CTERM sorting domain-containing protein [Phycisphaerae bacterium]
MASIRARLCAGMAAGCLWAVSSASAVPLSTLLMPGATLTSSNGAVTFSNFVYMTTVGAPNPSAVDVSADGSVPGGLRVTGPFVAMNGDALDVIFGFDAQLSQGAFTSAALTLVTSNAAGTIMGPGGDILAQSSVVINEEIRPLPGPGPETDLFVLNDVVGPDQLSTSGALNPAIYDAHIQVRKDMGLISVQAPGGGGVASVNVFTQDFVPEPSSLVLLLGAGLASTRRRRRN